VPTGGVASVASLPEQRRKGTSPHCCAGRLAEWERGQAISTLYTPHPALYRKYGWEIVTSALEFSLNPKDVRPIREAKGVGGRRVDFDSWALLDGVYLKHVRERNGPLLRSEPWWREVVLGGAREPWDAAVCESEGGIGLRGLPRRVDTSSSAATTLR
jgi:predicted acetyltransferase